MRREKRAAILSQLREIHDGEFKRDFGTGETKTWKGRVSVIAAVTPILERHYSIFSVLGERFMQVRWHRPDSAEAGEWAIGQQGAEETIREEIRGAIRDVFDSLNRRRSGRVPRLNDQQRTRIAAMAEVVALGRTHVFRNGYGNREIEYVPEAEANTRISKALAAIAIGIAALHGREQVAEEDIQDALRVGLDSMPDARRRVLLTLRNDHTVADVPISRTVKTRTCEELEALEILIKEGDTWQLCIRIKELLSVAAPKSTGEER